MCKYKDTEAKIVKLIDKIIDTHAVKSYIRVKETVSIILNSPGDMIHFIWRIDILIFKWVLLLFYFDDDSKILSIKQNGMK